MTINEIAVGDISDEGICQVFYDHGFDVCEIKRTYMPNSEPLPTRKSPVTQIDLIVLTRHRESRREWRITKAQGNYRIFTSPDPLG